MAKIKTRSSETHKTKPKGIHKRAFERVYWPYIPIVLAITLLLSVAAGGGSLQAYVRHPGGRVLAYASSMTISGLLADTNAARSSNGVAPLSLNSQLDAAAQASADDMAARDYWSHYTPEGNPPWVWVTDQGYSYQALAQNLATGFNDEQSTINGWMASPDHRTNMLNTVYKDVGFGFANNPNYTAAGGGPMTIVVAFYGEPQVLAASSTAPAESSPLAPTSSPTETPKPAPAAAAATAQPAAEQPQPSQQLSKTADKPAATTAPKQNISPQVKQSRAQLALTNVKISPAATSLTIVGALLLMAFWVSRHLVAAHRFLVKGERYIVRHPLTDIGLIIIASLLFILSQTAGIIQ